MTDSKKFQHVNLSINFSDFNLQAACGGGVTECNPGGSYICTGSSEKTCPPGSCAGTSVKKDFVDPINARILIAESELSKLKEELQKTILKFAKK